MGSPKYRKNHTIYIAEDVWNFVVDVARGADRSASRTAEMLLEKGYKVWKKNAAAKFSSHRQEKSETDRSFDIITNKILCQEVKK